MFSRLIGNQIMKLWSHPRSKSDDMILPIQFIHRIKFKWWCHRGRERERGWLKYSSIFTPDCVRLHYVAYFEDCEASWRPWTPKRWNSSAHTSSNKPMPCSSSYISDSSNIYDSSCTTINILKGASSTPRRPSRLTLPLVAAVVARCCSRSRWMTHMNSVYFLYSWSF